MNLGRKFCGIFMGIITMLIVSAFLCMPGLLQARNINEYSDTISNSAPSQTSNHTLSFILNTAISPGSIIEITPPADFEITASTSVFNALRNVELRVNGVIREVGSTLSAMDDLVEITPGYSGMIRYTLNTAVGIAAGSQLRVLIGNQTSRANDFSQDYSTSTGTTTTPADIKPITNSAVTGTQTVRLRIFDGAEVADTGFMIALIDSVGVGPVDTTETVPPLRFNGAPTSTLAGTTFGVELSIETDEFANCRYSVASGTPYNSMTNTFSNTGSIFHSNVVGVTPGRVYFFYVRCMDDENNINPDDYLIAFNIAAAPTGVSNINGTTSGNGTGSGNNGGGSGSGGGGTSGSSDGQQPTTGGSSGNGGSGGGSGGGGGGGSGPSGGGGFESSDGPYRSGDGQVTISGFTSPRSVVTTLVDGKLAKTGTAGSTGEYTIVLDLIARGVYTFGVYSTDNAKTKSSTFSTSFTVTGARASNLSNIVIAPSILLVPDPVNPGQPLTASGYAIPNSLVTLENLKDGNTASRKDFTAQANANGAWAMTIDTASFSAGTYKARAKAAQTGGLVSNFSNYTLYGVGQSANRPLNTDLNRDGKVNLVDFSILLFWWNTTGGDSDPSADINSDAKVNLTDFSILLFNWTG